MQRFMQHLLSPASTTSATASASTCARGTNQPCRSESALASRAHYAGSDCACSPSAALLAESEMAARCRSRLSWRTAEPWSRASWPDPFTSLPDVETPSLTRLFRWTSRVGERLGKLRHRHHALVGRDLDAIDIEPLAVSHLALVVHRRLQDNLNATVEIETGALDYADEAGHFVPGFLPEQLNRFRYGDHQISYLIGCRCFRARAVFTDAASDAPRDAESSVVIAGCPDDPVARVPESAASVNLQITQTANTTGSQATPRHGESDQLSAPSARPAEKEISTRIAHSAIDVAFITWAETSRSSRCVSSWMRAIV